MKMTGTMPTKSTGNSRWLVQSYFAFRVSFTEVAENIMSVADWVDWERGDFVFHMPYRPYDGVLYIGSMMNMDVARYYRYMWWTNRHVYYGVTEGPPIISPFNLEALRRMTVITPSQYVRMELEGIGVKVAGVIPHCIDIDRIRSIPRNNEWRKMFGDKFVALYVAHRHLRKGFRELCEAWMSSRAGRDPGVILVLHTSREPNRTSGEDYIIPEEGNIVVTDNVLKLDRQSLYALYRSADLYIHGGLAEGFGIPVVEAIAAGVPVLTVDAPPMSETNRVREARVKVMEQRVVVDRGLVTYRLNIPDPVEYSELIDKMVYDREFRTEVMERQQEYVGEYSLSAYKRFKEFID